MIVDLGARDEDLWPQFFDTARSWDLNYAEFHLTKATMPDLSHLERVLRSDGGWDSRTGEHWEHPLVSFSEALLLAGRGLEQVRVDVGVMRLSCIVEWLDEGAGLQVELALWPPDLLRIDDEEFERIAGRADRPPMPADFTTVLRLIRGLKGACGFRSVELVMEGDS